MILSTRTMAGAANAENTPVRKPLRCSITQPYHPAFRMALAQNLDVERGVLQPLAERLLLVVDVADMAVNLVKHQDRTGLELQIMQRFHRRGVNIHVKMHERRRLMPGHEIR